MLIELPEANIWEYLAELNSDKTAYEESHLNISYSQFHEKTDRLASKLLSKGIYENSSVFVLISSHSKMIETIISLWKIGAVPIIANPNMTSAEVNNYCNKINVNFIISSSEWGHCFDYKVISFKELNPDTSGRIIHDKTNAHSKIVLYSSGSTGSPKSVVHTLQNIYNSALNTDNIENYGNSDIFLSSLPINHIGGLMIFFRSFFCGGKVVIPDSTKTDDLVKVFLDKKISIASFVPTQLFRFVQNNLTSPKDLRSVYLGGDCADPELISKALRLGWKIKSVYGSTETCSMISLLDCKKHSNKISSSGMPLINSQVKIASDGELLLKTNSLFTEYLHDSELTTKSSLDGYFRSGDFGYIDEDRFLFIESRKRNFIISGGKNIDPLEVEKALLSINKIQKAVVFPLEDLEWGQIVCAAIESAEHYSNEEIKEKLIGIISSYKIPKRLLILKELPRNKMGKFLMKELKKLTSKTGQY